MYKRQDNGLQLFNGIFVSFNNGIKEISPQAFWSFFNSDEVKHTTVSAIRALEESLKKVDGIQIIGGEKAKIYSLERINAVITITQEGHSAYPSAVGFQQSQEHPGTIVTAAQYAGDEKEFSKFYGDYKDELRREQ